MYFYVLVEQMTNSIVTFICRTNLNRQRRRT